MLIRKKDLIDKITNNLPYHKYEVKEVLSEFISLLREETLTGNDIDIEGFGRTVTNVVPARTIVHPKTKVPTDYPPTRKVRFVLHASFKQKVKDAYEQRAKDVTSDQRENNNANAT